MTKQLNSLEYGEDTYNLRNTYYGKITGTTVNNKVLIINVQVNENTQESEEAAGFPFSVGNMLTLYATSEQLSTNFVDVVLNFGNNIIYNVHGNWTERPLTWSAGAVLTFLFRKQVTNNGQNTSFDFLLLGGENNTINNSEIEINANDPSKRTIKLGHNNTWITDVNIPNYEFETDGAPYYTIGTRTEEENNPGAYSISLGQDNSATGENSIAVGEGLIAETDNQIVLGQYNATNDRSENYTLLVGAGNSDNNRYNGFGVDNQGNIDTAGHVTIHGTSPANQHSQSISLAPDQMAQAITVKPGNTQTQDFKSVTLVQNTESTLLELDTDYTFLNENDNTIFIEDSSLGITVNDKIVFVWEEDPTIPEQQPEPIIENMDDLKTAINNLPSVDNLDLSYINYIEAVRRDYNQRVNEDNPIDDLTHDYTGKLNNAEEQIVILQRQKIEVPEEVELRTNSSRVQWYNYNKNRQLDLSISTKEPTSITLSSVPNTNLWPSNCLIKNDYIYLKNDVSFSSNTSLNIYWANSDPYAIIVQNGDEDNPQANFQVKWDGNLSTAKNADINGSVNIGEVTSLQAVSTDVNNSQDSLNLSAPRDVTVTTAQIEGETPCHYMFTMGENLRINNANGTAKNYFVKNYVAGDSFSLSINTAGFITSDAKDVRFTIPLNRPVMSGVKAKLTYGSDQGYILRNWNNYTHGSSATTAVKPASTSVAVHHYGLSVNARFSKTTNATNNSPIGINCTGTITFY